MLSANNYAGLVSAVLGAGLKSGVFTEEDKQEYIKAWSATGRADRRLELLPRQRTWGRPPARAHLRTRKSSPSIPATLTVKVPTLVIWGEKDTALLTQNLDGLDQFVPQLTIKRIPDGSHWVIHEKPAEVNADIRDFIR